MLSAVEDDDVDLLHEEDEPTPPVDTFLSLGREPGSYKKTRTERMPNDSDKYQKRTSIVADMMSQRPSQNNSWRGNAVDGSQSSSQPLSANARGILPVKQSPRKSAQNGNSTHNQSSGLFLHPGRHSE